MFVCGVVAVFGDREGMLRCSGASGHLLVVLS